MEFPKLSPHRKVTLLDYGLNLAMHKTAEACW